MDGLVLDTHTVLWYLADAPELSDRARQAVSEAFASGKPVYVASISLAEAIYLTEKGRIPAAALTALIFALLEPASSLRLLPLDLQVALAIREIPRELVPDMPDRIIAATASSRHLPLVTKDARIRDSGIPTIW